MSTLSREKCIKLEKHGFKYNPRTDNFEKAVKNKLLIIPFDNFRSEFNEDEFKTILKNIQCNKSVKMMGRLSTDLPPFYYELKESK